MSGGVRTETDTMGAIDVPADRYWGAQTARSLRHFPIGDERLPVPLIRAIGILKEAAALVNADLGTLSPEKSAFIVTASRSWSRIAVALALVVIPAAFGALAVVDTR